MRENDRDTGFWSGIGEHIAADIAGIAILAAGTALARAAGVGWGWGLGASAALAVGVFWLLTRKR
jgi:hypothetical protein